MSQLINALEGAAVNAAAGAASNEENKPVEAGAAPPAAPPAAPVAVAPTIAPSAPVTVPQTPGGVSPAAVDNSNAPKIDPSLAQQVSTLPYFPLPCHLQVQEC